MALGGSTQQYTVQVVPQEKGFHRSFCTRERTCTGDGWRVAQQQHAVYGISDSGWMDGANFLSWFTKLFLPAVSYLTETAPVLLFLDSHHSHISLELIRRARGSNILLLCLPPTPPTSSNRLIWEFLHQ